MIHYENTYNDTGRTIRYRHAAVCESLEKGEMNFLNFSIYSSSVFFEIDIKIHKNKILFDITKSHFILKYNENKNYERKSK